MSLAKRVGCTLALAVLLMTPRSWLDRRLHTVFVAELRPRLSDFIPLRQRGSAAGGSA
jgi:hypothetical protein